MGLWDCAYLPGQDCSCSLRAVLWRRLWLCIVRSFLSQQLGKGIWDQPPLHLPQEQSVSAGEEKGLTVGEEKQSGLLSVSWRWAFAQTPQGWTEHAIMFIHQRNVFIFSVVTIRELCPAQLHISFGFFSAFQLE